MWNVNLLYAAARVGRRLAAVGREARAASHPVAGAAADQVTEALGAALGEVVRAAVIGAVTAVRGAAMPSPGRPASPDADLWDEYLPGDDEPAGAPPTMRPRWATTTRAVGSALSVAAGAAAAVPGGRGVAAGLGGLAAVAGLAAQAGEPLDD